MGKDKPYNILHILIFILLMAWSNLWPSIAIGAGNSSGKADLAEIEQFQQGNEYYRQEQYDLAIKEYLNLVTQGYEEPFLLYNLGNAYFKKGELGWAILFYERAKQSLPRDIDLKKNLAYADSLTIDKIEREEPGFLAAFLTSWLNYLSLNELTIMATIIYFLIIILAIIFIFKKQGPIKNRLFQLLTLFSILFILTSLVILYQIFQTRLVDSGVIIAKVLEIKTGPEDNLATLFTLHEGTTFSIEQQRGDWFQIKLENGLSGWVKSKDIEKI